MLSIKGVKFGNIGRFVSEQSIDFSVLDRIVEVGAHNKNTGGSSGAGKSTVFHALDYLLGINEIPATALQSRLTKSHLYVEGDFDVQGTPLKIRRSKKDGLYIKFGDEEISGNVKLAEERLEEIVGIPNKLFKKMVHKKQKEGGFFLNLTAKESYDFLMKVLGLGEVTKKTFKIDDDIKKYISDIESLSSNIEYLEKSITEFKEVMDMNTKPKSEYTKEDLEKAEKALEKSKSEKEAIEKQRKEELGKLVKPVKKEVSIEPNPKIKELEQELAETQHIEKDAIHKHAFDSKKAQDAKSALESKLQEIPFHKQQMENAIADMKEKMEHRKHLEDEKCPTCSQKWVGDSAQEKIENINTLIKSLKEKIIDKKTLVDEEPELKDKLERVKEIQAKIEKENKLDDIRKKISKIKEDIVTLKAMDNSKYSEVEKEYLSELNKYNEKVNHVNEKYGKQTYQKIDSDIENYSGKVYTIKSHIENYERSLSEYEDKKEKLQKTIKEKNQELKENQDKRELVRKNLSIAEEAKRALKTYTLQVFQDTLDYIGSYASEILSNIPNMAGTTIYFEGCKETKSGNIKDEVNAIINMDGYNNVNIKTLSGGERTAIDLAVDLAVIDMIESKAGKGADFFILDEPFDGLEEINISQCLEILQQIDTNKKIIIVDHNPIAKEMINDRIIIERNGEESVVL